MAQNNLLGIGNNLLYPQTPLIDERTGMPTQAWQQFFLNLTNFKPSSTASSGGAVLPSNPAGFVIILVSGKQYKLPYYNV